MKLAVCSKLAVKVAVKVTLKVMLKVKVRVTVKVTGVCACRKIKTLGEVRVTVKVLRFNMVKWFRFNQPR